MKVNELIDKLSALSKEHGDLMVTVSDGFDYRFYKGRNDHDFTVEWLADECVIDIGVGGCDWNE